MAVFSTERNPVVGHRCNKLGIPCFQALTDKPGGHRVVAGDDRRPEVEVRGT